MEPLESFRFVSLCLLWYASSALTNTSTKSILNTFNFPVTLTFIQFGLVSAWCGVYATIAKDIGGVKVHHMLGNRTGILTPTLEILLTTAPLSAFQIGGHMFSSIATSKIPVSTVHTIKALSPLFTVIAYRVVFGVRYSFFTYLTLVPLMLGVVLTCSFRMTSDYIGLTCALAACIVFVTQNIFSKRLLFRDDDDYKLLSREHLDKMNILFYSSGLGFILMSPIWFRAEGLSLLRSNDLNFNSSLIIQFIFNGTVHFAQNLLAFSLLSLVSPVSYSIASSVKRIFVISVSIIWFGQPTTWWQALGIVLTFVGLYGYDRAKMDVARGERKAREDNSHILPTTQQETDNNIRIYDMNISNGHTAEAFETKLARR